MDNAPSQSPGAPKGFLPALRPSDLRPGGTGHTASLTERRTTVPSCLSQDSPPDIPQNPFPSFPRDDPMATACFKTKKPQTSFPIRQQSSARGDGTPPTPNPQGTRGHVSTSGDILGRGQAAAGHPTACRRGPQQSDPARSVPGASVGQHCPSSTAGGRLWEMPPPRAWSLSAPSPGGLWGVPQGVSPGG